MASLEVNNVNHGVVGDVIWVKPKVNGHTLKMEQDTGSAISTLPLETYKETFPNTPLVDTTAILKTLMDSWSKEKDGIGPQSARRPSTQ